MSAIHYTQGGAFFTQFNLLTSATHNNLSGSVAASGSKTYSYDANGNMITDQRENLNYQYNSLNLVGEVKQGSAVKATYRWLSDGTKAQVQDGGNNGYAYLGSLIYRKAGSSYTLESVGFGGGRLMVSSSTVTPNYQITDHLGSVRVLFSNKTTVLARNDFYAFGKRHVNSSLLTASDDTNRWLFNGKEKQTTGNLSLLDFNTRMYNPEFGRFGSVDVRAEDFTHQSPFVYADNNPVRFIDFMGMYADDADSLKQVYFSRPEEHTVNGGVVEGEPNERQVNDNRAVSTWDYGIPMWGAARLSNEAWNEGRYFDSAGWFLVGLAEGISVGMLIFETQALKTAAVQATKVGRIKGGALVAKYPSNAAISGTTERTYLMPGQVIDRYGSLSGNWFSTPGTSYGARSIPPGLSPYTRFQVVKPFEVQKSFASPGMFSGQTGFGVQFQSAVGADVLIKREIIIPFKP